MMKFARNARFAMLSLLSRHQFELLSL